MNKIKSRIIQQKHRLLLVALVTTSLVLSVAALQGGNLIQTPSPAFAQTSQPTAQPNNDITGEWVGSIETKSGDLVAVNLTIGELTPRQGGTTLNFGPPRDCYLDAEYSGEKEGKHIFGFKPNSQPVCQRYSPGQLIVYKQSDGMLHFEARSRDGKHADSGPLKRSG